jgi:hypothetical protein
MKCRAYWSTETITSACATRGGIVVYAYNHLETLEDREMGHADMREQGLRRPRLLGGKQIVYITF